MLVLGGGLFLLPEKNNNKDVNPEEIMWSTVQSTRFITTDEVAKMIIENDPTLELIDVRSEDDYAEFSLEKAINIPLDSIATEDYQQYLGIKGLKAIFYSNDDIKADQAWVIAKRLGYKNIYVMKGGLNSWMTTIIEPVKPVETASSEEFELYGFRKGASIYFTGSNIETPGNDTKAVINVTRKKKQSVVEGGC